MPALEDDAIASVVMTANTGEIEEAQLASTAAAAQSVHALATRIETDHRTSNERALATLGALGSDSDPHPLRTSLVENHAQAMQALSPLRGPSFDRAFVERQIALHRYLLSTIDHTLMPSARTGPVRAQLTADRAAVAAHLEMAETTLRGLGGG